MIRRLLARLRVPLLVLACLMLSPVVTGCGSSNPAPKDPQALGAAVRSTVRVGYAGAVFALGSLEKARVEWQRAQLNPSPADLDVGHKLKITLHSARDALAAAKPWLESGDGGPEAKRRILEAFDYAAVALQLLRSAGNMPPEVGEGLTKLGEGLTMAREALGGAS